MRYYRVDILDFYRGTLTARRVCVLLEQLPADAALVRALNDGKPGWSLTDHLLADLWALLLNVNSDQDSTPDHPVRAEMRALKAAAEKATRAAELKARFDRLKRKYLGGGAS